MRAIQINKYGGPEQLEEVVIPKPQARANQVVVKILAASLNPVDVKITGGAMREFIPLQFPWIPGRDFAGIVESGGADAVNFQPGDKVFGYSDIGGAYAEYIAIDVDKIALKPGAVTYAESASLATVAQTAIQALDEAGLLSGQTILILGAGGAVGNVAVQLAHRQGARIIASASADSLDRLRGYGAQEVLDYKITPFQNVARGVDVVLDCIGGETQQQAFSTLKPGGVLISIVQPPNLDEAVKHRVRATMVQTRSDSNSLHNLALLIDSGEIKPFVGKTYPLTQAANVWRQVKTEHIEGKIVFTVNM